MDSLGNTSGATPLREREGLTVIQVCAVPIIFILTLWLLENSHLETPGPIWVAGALSGGWLAAALIRFISAQVSLLLFGVTTASLLVAIIFGMQFEPTRAFPVIAIFLLHLNWMWEQREFQLTWKSNLGRALKDGSWFCLFLWLLLGAIQLLWSQEWLGGLLISNLLLGFFFAAYGFLEIEGSPQRRWLVRVVALVLVGWTGFQLFFPGHSAYWITLIVPISGLVLSRSSPHYSSPGWLDNLLLRPELMILIVFVGLSFVGTIGLLLPASYTTETIATIDAAFTAVSAVCVTGLIVLDTPVQFSLLGQGLILALIQLGGLGIMAFSAVATFLLGQQQSFRHDEVLAGVAGYQIKPKIRFLLRDVLIITFLIEAIGACLLSLEFNASGDPMATAIWRGVFTSVSAFCNAGFSLQTESLIPYHSNGWITNTIGVLIILGGLSPGFLMAVYHLRRNHRTTLQVKVAAAMTGALLLTGFLFFLTLEWGNTLAPLSIWDKIHNAWFQSITVRTAGFNSVDLSQARHSTLYILMALMFIGGSPGGTAGGIKTTTVFILFGAVVDAFRGTGTVSAFGRRISTSNVFKAAAVATAGISVGFVLLISLSLTQDMDPMMTLFESVSALGTVGLSIGGTAKLDSVGKVIIMFGMLLGRIGPITVFLLLGRPDKREHWTYPEEQIVVN